MEYILKSKFPHLASIDNRIDYYKIDEKENKSRKKESLSFISNKY